MGFHELSLFKYSRIEEGRETIMGEEYMYQTSCYFFGSSRDKDEAVELTCPFGLG